MLQPYCCCTAWLISPSSPCLCSSHPPPYPHVVVVAHQFAAPISHLSPSTLFFPCRALCTHCGSPQRIKDVCFICLTHAKEDSVFLLQNTVLKSCLSGLPTSMKRLGFLCLCSWVLTLLLVFGGFSLLYVALPWSSVELFLELTSSWRDAPCLQGEFPAKGPTWGILWWMALVWKPNSSAVDQFLRKTGDLLEEKAQSKLFTLRSHSDSGW